MFNEGLWLSQTVEWGTPDQLFKDLEYEFGKFDLDPCANKENHMTLNYYGKDGLKQPWCGSIYCNPPYGRSIGDWIKKRI